ncbi:hypothetical protein [Streptomyces galilaeus]|uniref:Uncharacterized protein n=1 Tax=Streptomyces galilaeus TaxID=33899 RepID=A0ABW9ITJ1_STRGJ
MELQLGRVLELGDSYGRPTATPWTPQQTETYETAWQHWRDLALEVQAAVTQHATEQDKPRFGVEAAVRTKARHPDPVAAWKHAGPGQDCAVAADRIVAAR